MFKNFSKAKSKIENPINISTNIESTLKTFMAPNPRVKLCPIVNPVIAIIKNLP